MIADCTLSPDGLRAQQSRAAELRRAVERVERTPRTLEVTFGAGVDRTALDELIETERGCCSFLEIGYHESARVLRLGVEAARHSDVLDAFAAFFGQEVAA